nr:hypothetical protein [Klebsiella pneumoniae]
MISRHIPLRNKKDLRFEVKEISVIQPYDIYWKVLNRGEVAKRKIIFEDK